MADDATAPAELSYFDKRLQELGLTDPKQYTVSNYEYGSFKRGEEGFHDCSFPIFQEDTEGNIRIYYPSLSGLKSQYRRNDSKSTKDYFITRLKEPKGDMKYVLPGKSGTLPFLPPGLIKKFREKQEIKTLILTEGAFKAFKGEMHGLDIIGLSSITHAKDRYTLGLHEDIRTIIKTCKVSRVIWLVDGDCNRLAAKPIEQIDDLYKRPNQFYHSARTVRQFIDEFQEVEKWFVHPISDELDDLKNPKGLDDLLIALKGNEEDAVRDLLNFHKKGNWNYFHKIDITHSHGPLYRYFHLKDVNEFYLHHIERRKDLAQAKDFVFNGTRYQWNDEKNTCDVIIPGDAKNYFRVGDQYFEKIHVPNKFKELEYAFHRRMKTTIQDDYGREFCKHISKYKAFCNSPDHVSYNEVIHSCFNVYAPFEHIPDDEGECTETIKFIKHIFGEKEIKFKHPKTDEIHIINEYDLGLDYLQLLYQKPTQILPILCLVSKENGTGKTTFSTFLKLIFTQNVAIVGNADLANDFNASWSSKLLIVCDEAKIDKQLVVEKVKALSTANKVFMNSKGKDQMEIDFFGKFILLSNNEDNFVYANDEDVRWWIRKVPVITELNVSLTENLLNEIPAFLHFLNKRKLVTENLHRGWIHPNLLRTEALMKVVQNSRPTIEKEIRNRIREMFLDFDVSTILFTPKKLNEEFFKGRMELNYLIKVLKENMKLDLYQNKEGKEVPVRYVFPRFEPVLTGGSTEVKQVEVKDMGRPYVFHMEKFLTQDEISSRNFDSMAEVAAVDSKDDLPY